MSESVQIGCGSYTITQAARLIGVPVRRLRSWAVGSAERPPVIKRRFATSDILTFAELMELQFVQMFRREGVSLTAIRRAAQAASRKFRTDHPFAVKRFDTDGRTIFATLHDMERDLELVEDLAHGQYVFQRIIRPFFKKLDYGGRNEVERYWPLNRAGRVVLDPMRRAGQPIDPETGVPIDAILDALKAGGGQDEKSVARWLGVSLKAVRDAQRFESSLAV